MYSFCRASSSSILRALRRLVFGGDERRGRRVLDAVCATSNQIEWAWARLPDVLKAEAEQGQVEKKFAFAPHSTLSSGTAVTSWKQWMTQTESNSNLNSSQPGLWYFFLFSGFNAENTSSNQIHLRALP